ncbi:MAG: acyl-CoA carboxylase subunit beta [Chloroflexota bacterium]
MTDPPAAGGRARKLAELRAGIDAQHAAAAEKQASRGKRGARERAVALLDSGSFTELDAFKRHRASDLGMDRSRPWGDGVVTGWGTIDGRPVAVFSQDFTVFGGSLGEAFAEKIVKVMDLAARMGIPIVGINDSAGARIQEGVEGLAGYGEVFYRNARLSGVIPQISVIAGPCAGGAVYSPAMTDFVMMVDRVGQMFITGPDVIKTVTGEDVTMEALGGAAVHHAVSGAAHLVAPDEDAGNEIVRALLSFLPSNNLEDPPRAEPLDDPDREDPALDAIAPETATKPYDMHRIIESILDDGDFLEIQPAYAPNIICGFGRLDGHPAGIVANQPMHLAGTLDIAASEKAARFVRTCDAFNVPLVVLEDVPGFLPGLDQEHQGIIRRGSKLLYAFAEATVPKITVIIRKAYGGAYVVMNSKHIGADANFAWPTAEIAVMGPDAAVGLIFRRELAEAADPAARRRELITDYEDRFASPYQAAGRGYIDDVIDPRATRPRLIRTLALARTKRVASPPRKHGNIPL